MAGNDSIDLSNFFRGAVNGVTHAQRYLEARRIEGRSMNYAIPRAAMSFELSFRHDAVNGGIFERKRRTSEETGVQVNFSLLATPTAPLPPPSIDGSNLQSVVALPWFLVHDKERNQLTGTLIDRLNSRVGVLVDMPETDPAPSRGQFAREVREIRKTLKNDTKPKPDDSIGVIALALDESRTSFLIVRLGEPPEGIFILRNTPDIGATVYCHRNADGDKFFYTPLRLAMVALGNWTSSGQRGVTQPPQTLPAQLGPIPTGEVSRKFWIGQAEARQQLSQPDSDALRPAAQPRAFYQLAEVTAALSYTVPPEEGSDIDHALVYSEMRVTPRDPDPATGAPARADLTLISPEYLVTGAGRETLLDLIQGKGDLVSKLASSHIFPRGTEESYRQRISDKDSRKQAVITLSYRDKTPVNQFLVVWRQMWDDEPRDFAFRVHVRNGAIDHAEFLLPLEDPDTLDDPIPRPPKPLDEITISKDGYVGFHDFLHAIRIWDLNSRPLGGSAA